MASARQCLLNQFADLSVCANQNNLHKNSILVSDLRIYLFTFNLGTESPRELADADLLASALPNNFAVLATGELMSLPSFSVMFCIDWYKNRRFTNACQMLYLLIGMKSETVATQRGRPRAFDKAVFATRS